MPRITITHEDLDALNITDDMSDARVIFIDNHETVSFTVELDRPEGWDHFNALPGHLLPPLSPGYEWARVNNKYCIIREHDAKEQELLLVIYGPDKVTNKVNFIFQINKQTTYSFAHTKNGKGPDNRDYPMSSSDYEVIGFDYKKHKYSAHVRGHLVDHQDTILNASTKDLWSTVDPRNYVPEPPDFEWGLGFRNQKVRSLRKQKGGAGYAQLNLYPKKPLLTRNGTAVPEDVKFIAYKIEAQKNYTADESFNVEFDEDLSRPSGMKVLDYATSHFMIDFDACPITSPYSPDTSDRAFRLQGRNQFYKIAKIEDGTISSRFKRRDILTASYQAGDHEFETAGRRLSAGGMFSKANNPEDSKVYAKRSLLFGDKLSKLDDDNIQPYTESDKKTASQFLKDLDDDEALLDHFNSFSV